MAAAGIFLAVPAAQAQTSHYSLRFYGTGVGPPGDQDRVKIPINSPGNPLNVGDDFTIEFWMRCRAADNNGVVYDTNNGDGWITGNVVVDRDVFFDGDYGDFGVSIGAVGGSRVVAFGLSRTNLGRTIVGTNNVGDDLWHHVAVTRVRSSGLMRIYVDGRLDAQGFGPTGHIGYRVGRPTSYPNSDPYLVLAAEKHDAGAAYPSFNGFLDEFRVWTQALSQAEISNVYWNVLATNTPGLVAYYRFEEGSGTNVYDLTGLSPVGRLIAGVTNNGQWMPRSVDTNWTAPLGPPAPPPPPPPMTNVTIHSVPSGLAIILDGVSDVTPFTRMLPVTNWFTLIAPTNQTLNGTVYVFRCWSDAGPQNRLLFIPVTGLFLRAGYAPLPGGAVDQPVPAANRNVESFSGVNAFQNQYNANCLCAGRENAPSYRYEPAMAFPLAIPAGASIQTATLRLRGFADNSGSPTFIIRAYNVSNIAPFVGGSGPSVTGLYPLTSASVTWSPPAFATHGEYDSPNLAAVIQEVINRPDWSPGNYLGLVVLTANGSGDHWRCWSNQQSGTPPRLLVQFGTSASDTPDIDGDGMHDAWETANGFDCTSASPPDRDSDGDGFPDLHEFVALTDPNNPSDFHRILLAVSTNATDQTITVPTATGRLYRIEASSNVMDSTWIPIATNLQGVGVPIVWVETNSLPARFFRSGVQLAP
ncbi:MAG: LamG domain-containing protein [Kiritimatiellae bacterium]|nr:LamG domain-containing protein [Kiritimatiellia bacterium]MDW8459065.1 LamG-like jellyroll fold domain-containing protein [Verrucomicrobiota bacterium]